jgi:hypothetical protein
MKSRVHGAIVLMAICSWFAISNHCAFAALATKTDAASTECPFHSKPAKQENQPAGIQCCKTLRAVVPVVTKSWMRDDANFSGVDFRREECASTEYFRTALTPLSLDMGPPDAHSFAELVLQRSLLAHAPPIRA